MKKSTKVAIVGMLAAGVSLTSIPAANARQAAPEASTATVTLGCGMDFGPVIV